MKHVLLLFVLVAEITMIAAVTAATVAVNITNMLDQFQTHVSTFLIKEGVVATAKGITTFIKNDLENDADNLILTVDLTAAKKIPRKDDLKIVVYHANSVVAAVACEGYLVEYIDQGYFKCSLSNNDNVRFVNGVNHFDLEVYGARTGKRYARQRIPGGVFYLDPSIVTGYSPYGENVISDKNITYALQVLQVSMGTMLFKVGIDQVLDKYIDNSQGGKKKRPPRPPPRPKSTTRTVPKHKKSQTQNKPIFGLFGSTTYTNTGVKVVSSHDQWSQPTTKAKISTHRRPRPSQKKKARVVTTTTAPKKKVSKSSTTGSLPALLSSVSGVLASVSARITSIGAVNAWITSLDNLRKRVQQAISVLDGATQLVVALVVLLPSLGVMNGASSNSKVPTPLVLSHMYPRHWSQCPTNIVITDLKGTDHLGLIYFSLYTLVCTTSHLSTSSSLISKAGSESYQRSLQKNRKNKGKSTPPSSFNFNKIGDKIKETTMTKKASVTTNKVAPAPAPRRPSTTSKITSAYAV